MLSPDAARALAKRLQSSNSRPDGGKKLVNVGLAEINHTPPPARPPGGHQVDTLALKNCIDSLQQELAKVEAIAAGHRAVFEWERDRAERERDRAERLMAELLKATADMMAVKEATARLEGELAALRSRPWWK